MTKPRKSEPLAAVHETMRDLHRAGVIDDARMSKFDATCMEVGQSAPQRRNRLRRSMLSFLVFKDVKDKWRWRLVAADGRVIAESGESYRLRKECLEAIALVKSSPAASIVV